MPTAWKLLVVPLAAMLALATAVAAGRAGSASTIDGPPGHRTLLQRAAPCGGRRCTGNEVCATIDDVERCVCKPGKWAHDRG